MTKPSLGAGKSSGLNRASSFLSVVGGGRVAGSAVRYGHHVGRGVSLLDLDALPEGDPALDLGCRRARVGVVPGGVGVHLAAHLQMVVARGALPVAVAVGV